MQSFAPAQPVSATAHTHTHPHETQVLFSGLDWRFGALNPWEAESVFTTRSFPATSHCNALLGLLCVPPWFCPITLALGEFALAGVTVAGEIQETV